MKPLPGILHRALCRQSQLDEPPADDFPEGVRAAGFNGHKSVTGSIQYAEESAPTVERTMPPNVICAAFSPGQGARAGSIGYAEEIAPTLKGAESGTNRVPAVVYDGRGNGDGKTACTLSGDHDSRTGDYANVVVMPEYVVRRLTPKECERLQGFPDDWTRYMSDGRELKDSPRYKGVGNAVAVPCAEYVMRGIAAVLEKEKGDESDESDTCD
jgi:DNA (cytosine-5)-methyltransferase 1